MFAIQTQDLELTHYRSADDDTRRIDADWPIYRGTGATSTAVVYFELAPGKRLGTHTDSAATPNSAARPILAAMPTFAPRLAYSYESLIIVSTPPRRH